MATVADVLARKGARVFAITPAATVLEATRVMNRHKIGALVVTNSQHFFDEEDHTDRVAGMITERDVLTRLVAEQRDPAQTLVETIMTTDVAFCTPQDDIDMIAATFQQRRIRHLPVCDEEGQVIGMISIGDLNAWHAMGKDVEIHYLHEYIHGRV